MEEKTSFTWSILSGVPVQPIDSWMIYILRMIDNWIPRMGPLKIIPKIGGDLYELADKGFFRFIMDLLNQSNGDQYVNIRMGHLPLTVIFDAHLSKQILLSSNVKRGLMYDRLTEFFGFGIFTSKIPSRWLHQRRMIINLLNGHNLKQMTPLLAESMFNALDRQLSIPHANDLLEKGLPKQRGPRDSSHGGLWGDPPVDLVSLLSIMGLIGFCEVFFGVNIDDIALDLIDPLNRILLYINGAVEPFTVSFDPAYKNFLTDKNYVHDWMRQLILRAQHSPTCHPLILQTIDNHSDGLDCIDDELIEFILSIVLGGHETTARLMLGIIYCLYHDPHCVKTMNMETQQYYEHRTAIISPQYEIDILQQPYLKNVINEGTRLFPPVWILGRETTQDLVLGDVTFVKGTQMLISPLIFLRSSQIWGDDAEVFNPDRFNQMSEEQKKIFIPFIVGKESCPGKLFAELEACIVISQLFYNYDIQFLEHTLNPTSAGTFRLTDYLPVIVTKKFGGTPL